MIQIEQVRTCASARAYVCVCVWWVAGWLASWLGVFGNVYLMIQRVATCATTKLILRILTIHTHTHTQRERERERYTRTHAHTLIVHYITLHQPS